MTKYYHISTNKNYVLRSISMRLNAKGDWKYLDILVFKNRQSKIADRPESYEELEKLLKDYDKVYEFYEAESNMNGLICYDIILEGPEEEDK